MQRWVRQVSPQCAGAAAGASGRRLDVQRAARPSQVRPQCGVDMSGAPPGWQPQLGVTSPQGSHPPRGHISTVSPRSYARRLSGSRSTSYAVRTCWKRSRAVRRPCSSATSCGAARGGVGGGGKECGVRRGVCVLQGQSAAWRAGTQASRDGERGADGGCLPPGHCSLRCCLPACLPAPGLGHGGSKRARHCACLQHSGQPKVQHLGVPLAHATPACLLVGVPAQRGSAEGSLDVFLQGGRQGRGRGVDKWRSGAPTPRTLVEDE